MKWKTLYTQINTEEYSIITDINQPATLRSTISNFFKKYLIAICLWFCVALLLIITTYNFNLQLLLAVISICFILLIALVYYNTFKLEINDDKLTMNIMFREITIPNENLLNIYVQRRRSFILLVIPFYYYSINIFYKETKDSKEIKGLSLSTMMVMKEDILQFFNHFSFDKLPK